MNITPIVQAAFTLLAAIVTAFVVPYINSKTTASQQSRMNEWIRIAVTAAEQVYTGSGRGTEKKDFVFLWLRERGITVDKTQLDAMIEAAVYELKSGFFTVDSGALPEAEARPGETVTENGGIYGIG